MSKYNFRSACAVISGASSGIGLEIASILCAKYGCTVIGLARSKERLDRAAERIGENFIPFVCDVTVDSDRADLLKFITDHGFKPDILVNNAGILPPFSHFTPEKEDELERVMELNFRAHVKMCSAFLPLLLESDRGAIVNVASSAALAPLPGTAAYSASKSALLAFTQSLSLEYGKSIFVSAVCPGMTATDLFSAHEGASVIEKFAPTPEKAAKKIVRRLRRRRRKIVTGADAHLMSLGNRLFGAGALRFFAFFLRKVNLPIFKDTFYKS
jgi:short-subunit dehydrogenase